MRWPSISCSATPACRRSGTAPSSASAPTPSAWRSSTSRPNLWLCLAVATLAAAAGGALVALFISHRRGIYYALMTIAFGQVFWFIAIKAHGITGGEDGLLKIARLPAVARRRRVRPQGQRRALLLRAGGLRGRLAAAVAPGAFAVRARLKAIKQNETRARFVGYDVWRYKAAVLVISAGLSGLAGGLFAMAQASAFPDVMSLHYSGYVVMMTLVGGGLVSFWGPVIGAVVFFLARDVIGALTTGWMLWFGLLFVVLVLFKPEGIAGMFAGVASRERKPRAGRAASPQPQAR